MQTLHTGGLTVSSSSQMGLLVEAIGLSLGLNERRDKETSSGEVRNMRFGGRRGRSISGITKEDRLCHQ